MELGYRGNPTWRDMSEYVVHFTRDTPEQSAYDTMMSILDQRRLVPGGRFGAARRREGLTAPQEAVCFSEIPLDRLDRIVGRRGSKYGIGFAQDVLVAAGGGRIWYIDKGGQLAAAVREVIDTASGPPLDTSHPVWRLTPFIDFPGDYGDTRYRFEWEREWRVPGELHFTPDQVAFLFIPAELHETAQRFFQNARVDNFGPAYDCAFVDPLWTDESIRAALKR